MHVLIMKSKCLQILAGGAFLLLAGGCSSVSKQFDPTYIGPFHSVGNIYQVPGGIPQEIHRVAVMPLTHAPGNRSAERGVPLMIRTVTEELARARAFEIIAITPTKLDNLIGHRSLRADDKLPYNFVPKIKEETGCQAVLFVELTTYRAYPPVALGWKLHLFDLETEELIWAVDEVFDVGQSPVANSLRRHIREHHSPHNAAATQLLVLDSPRELARYSLGEITDHLRKNISKVAAHSVEETGSQTEPTPPATLPELPAPPPAEVPTPPEPPVPSV